MTKDPELRQVGDKSVVSFTVAINRTFANKSGEYEADFINVVSWRNADNIKQYTMQGSLVSVEGRIQSRIYEAKDGTKKYIIEVIADSVQFLESKNSKKEEKVEVKKEEPKEKIDPFADFGNNVEISEDDLPF